MRKKIVIKLGGSSLQNGNTLKELVDLISGCRQKNYDVILVHGGGPAINQALTSRGIQWKFINGQRQTTSEMMEVIEDVLVNKINAMLVDTLRAANIPAIGISGAQDQTLFCTQADTDLMQVGKIEAVNANIIEKYLSLEIFQVPVMAPIGIGINDEKYNINADWAAAKIAIAVKAEMLIFLTDQSGILDQDEQLIHQATPYLINKMIADGVISGGMYTKVLTMMMALNFGIRQVRVINAGVAGRLLTDGKIGTLLVDEKSELKKEVTAWNQQMI